MTFWAMKGFNHILLLLALKFGEKLLKYILARWGNCLTPTDIKLTKTNILNALKTQVIRDCDRSDTRLWAETTLMSSRLTHPLWRQCFLFYLGFWPLNSFFDENRSYYTIYIYIYLFFLKGLKVYTHCELCTPSYYQVWPPFALRTAFIWDGIDSTGNIPQTFLLILHDSCNGFVGSASIWIFHSTTSQICSIRDLVRVTVNLRSCSENQSGNFCFLTWHTILEPLEDGWTWSATMLE